ncbi:hypothetical protein Tco_0734412, partial [Tanacetum coccineum]
DSTCLGLRKKYRLSLKNDMPPRDKFSSLIWYDEDIYDLRSVETEFLAIVFNDNLTSNETLFCEPTYYKDGDCTRILQRPRTKTGSFSIRRIPVNGYGVLNEHIEKVLEIVDLFYILNITIDQVMLRAFPMSLIGATSHWLRNKPSEMQEVVLFYNGLDVPTRQILDSRGVIPSKTVVDVKVVIQEMAEYSQKWHNGTSRTRSTETSDGLAAIQAQLDNLGR